jgi:hypothetical protein
MGQTRHTVSSPSLGRGLVPFGTKGCPIAPAASSDDDAPEDEPKEPSTQSGRTLGLGGLLIELVFPVTLSASLLLALARYTRSWNLHSPLGLGIFVVLLVALSVVMSLRADAFTLARREERGKKQLLNRADARSRLVKFILGGVAIPIGVFAAANRVELPGHQTPMALATQLTILKPASSGAEQIGKAVLRAQSQAAKVQGILALQASGSDDALQQLFLILTEDPAASSGSEYQPLCKAIASFGGRARAPLMQRFEHVSPAARRVAGAPAGDLFERYLSTDFQGLQGEIASRNQPGEGPERLLAAEADLKRALERIETETTPAQGGSGLPALILQTFLLMDSDQDADVLAFAQRTAADAAWSDAIRGQALLLIGKMGGKDDLEGLYAYLENPSLLIQARGMQAIAALRSKLAAPRPGG